MKKISFIFIVFMVVSFNLKAQTSLPLQYLELAKKLITSASKPDEVTATMPNITSPPSSSLLVDYAKTLLGIPYRYATSNPKVGFDCSGFVNYVFSNFGFKVPRSSREFTGAGKETTLENAKVGDVLIFTGSNSKIRRVGHVGIVYAIDEDGIKFIHASSGKANSVTVTDLKGYYKTRFMKIVTII